VRDSQPISEEDEPGYEESQISGSPHRDKQKRKKKKLKKIEEAHARQEQKGGGACCSGQCAMF